MARQIALTRQPYRAEGGRFRYVYTANGAGSPTTPSEIFVMQLQPLDPTKGTRTAVYSSVANPSQLQDVPINAVTGNGSYYRSASYEAIYTSRDDADLDWVDIQAAVNHLLRSLLAADNALTAQTVTLTG